MTHRISDGAGIGLRIRHFDAFMAARPPLPFVEVHAENHLCGGVLRQRLHNVRQSHEISLHCVGMSIGSIAFNAPHARRIRQLCDEISPILVSDHLSVSTLYGAYSNDLVALPYTEEALDVACSHVNAAQDILGRQLLVENPSRYLSWSHSTIAEHEFLDLLARRTGCALLCDVNNLLVTALNEGRDPLAALRAFPARHVREVHLAGHDVVDLDGHPVRIDTHDRPVGTDVWALFSESCRLFGPQPALIEWDNELPELSVLLAEASAAAGIKRSALRRQSHVAAC